MKLRASLTFFVAAACASPAPVPTVAQDVAHFDVPGGAVPAKVTAGDVLPVTVQATIQPGWQVYSLTQKAGGPTPLAITVEPAPPFEVEGAVTGPVPTVRRDPTFGIDTETYDVAPSFVVPVRVAASASPGPRTIKVRVRSQACSDKVCLEAVTTSVDVAVVIAER